MRRHIRDALDTLEALGCQLDHADRETRKDRWIWTHANTPDETYKLNIHSSPATCRVVVHRAKVAAGLATSETPKPRQRAKSDQLAERRLRAAAKERAEAQRMAAEARAHEAKAAADRASLDRLLRGVEGAPSAAGIDPDAKYTPAQVADETGVSEREVLRAIKAERLTAYQCGNTQKVQGAEVRRWLARRTA